MAPQASASGPEVIDAGIWCDYDMSGVVDPADLAAYKTFFDSGSPLADVNHDKNLDIADLLAVREGIAAAGLAEKAGNAPAPSPNPPPPLTSCVISKLPPWTSAAPSATLTVAFPTGVEWYISIFDQIPKPPQTGPSKGLWLGPCRLRRPGETTFQPVIFEGGITEILTLYHQPNTPPDLPCQPVHLSDMQFTENTTKLATLDASVLPAGDAHLLKLSGTARPQVVVECRDRGLGWLCNNFDTNTVQSARGREVAIWSVFDVNNYDIIMEYAFRDDGVIEFRVGATGSNNSERPYVAHMHDVLWRVDVDLFGPVGDCSWESIHVEPDQFSGGCNNKALASDYIIPFNGGTEGVYPLTHFLDWNPLEFTSLLIEDANILNSYGNNVGYELVPWNIGGLARHYGYLEEWTEHDFYVTTYKSTETGYTPPYDWLSHFMAPDQYLFQGVAPFINGETVCATDDVIWVHSAAHHEPHDEDHAIGDPPGQINGVTLVHWLGFDMVPHNLFDYNPLGGPHQCGGPVNDYCENIVPVVLPDNNQTITFTGDNMYASAQCAALGAEEVWHAFTFASPATDDVKIDYCGNIPTHSPVFIVLDDACPCDGTFQFASSWDFTSCPGAGDTNITIYYNSLPAGTWYIPVYSAIDGTIGPYTIHVSR